MGVLAPAVTALANRSERGLEQRADALSLSPQPLQLGRGLPRDPARLRVRLGDYEVGLALRLLLELLRGTLGGHERRPQQRLELAVPHEVLLEVLHLVLDVGAVAPHVLEALDDVAEQLV